MPFFKRRRRGLSFDEFVGEGPGREASPLELRSDPTAWQARLGGLTSHSHQPRDLALAAFTLLRGGDLFERSRPPDPTPPDLLARYAAERIRPYPHGASPETQDAAVRGVLSVVQGNPAVCMRMLLAKTIDLILIPKDEGFHRYGFPAGINPYTVGVFYNSEVQETAQLGLREDLVHEKPWLMVHEMTHAVHLMGMTREERDQIDRFLLPVYGNRRDVEEALAIHAERAFGARYEESDLRAPGIYGHTRREWNAQAVFSLFVQELLRPVSTSKRP